MNKLENRWDKIISKKEEVIIGRDNFIHNFDTLYTSIDTRDNTILNFFGVGGIGKTTLLMKIKSHALDKGIPVFYYDLAKHKSIVDFYEFLYRWLQEHNISAIYFQMAFLAYWQRLYPNIEFKENLPKFIQEGGLIGDITALLVEGVAQEVVPIAGSMSKIFYKSYKKIAQRYNLDKELIALISEFESNEKTIEDIEDMLPYFFMKDLTKIKKDIGKEIVFLFDTYEKLYESSSIDKRTKLESWVENFSVSLQQNAMLVIAGREKLEWNKYDSVWDTLISYESLTALSYEDSITIIKEANIVEQFVIDQIAKLSQGYPFYIKLAIDAYKNSPSTFQLNYFEDLGLGEIFNRFVGNLNNDYLKILEYLTVPKYFDQELYIYILNETKIGYSNIVYKDIINYSFFSQVDNNFVMHELMRKSFHKQIDKKQQKHVHKIIYNFYENKNNKRYFNEIIYHLLQFGSESDINNWFKDIKKRLYSDGEYSLLAKLYSSALTHLEKHSNLKVQFTIDLALLFIDMDDSYALVNIINEFESMNIPANLLDDVSYIQAKKELNYIWRNTKRFNNNRVKVTELFKKVILRSDTIELKIRSYIELSRIYQKNKNSFDAISNLTIALNMTTDDYLKSRIYDKLGYLYLKQNNTQQSKKYFISAIELKKTILNSKHIEIGKSYRGLSKVFLKEQNIEKACNMRIESISRLKLLLDKWSNELYQEYKMLAKYKDDEWITIQSKSDLDIELFLLAKLDIYLKDNNNFEPIIKKINNLKDVSIDRCIKLAIIFIPYNMQEFNKYFTKAIEHAESYAEQRKIFLHIYLAFLRKKDYKQSEIFLLKIIEVSKQISLKSYINSLQLNVKFYQFYIKDLKKTLEIYIEIESLLKDKNELANLYQNLATYYKNLNYEEQLNYMNKELKVYNDLNDLYRQASVISKIINVSKKHKLDFNEKELLFKVLNIYEKTNNLGKQDSIYGKLAEYYEVRNKPDETLKYFELQITIRKKMKDDLKLSKGYMFFAKFIYKNFKDKEKSEYLYQQGIQIILKNKTKNYELLESYTRQILYFYKNIENFEKQKDIIDLRIQLAEESRIVPFKISAYKNLEFYYTKNSDIESAIKTVQKAFDFISEKTFKNEKIEVLERLISYTKDKDINEHIKYILYCYELYLSKDDTMKANSLFQYFLNIYSKKNINTQLVDSRYKAIFGNLIYENKFVGYAFAIKQFKEYNFKNRWSFIFSQIRKLKKKYSIDPDIFYKIYTNLEKNNAYNEAAIFYESYFDLKLTKLKGQYDDQQKLYELSEIIFKRLNNQKMTSAFQERYLRFKKRIDNMQIIDGYVVDKILTDVINKLMPFNQSFQFNEAEKNLKKFINECSKDIKVMNKIKNHKLNTSVIFQGINILIPNFKPIYFGFETNQLFLSWLLTGTVFQVGKIKQKNNFYIIYRNNNNDKFEVMGDIIDYEKYVHNENNYAILLSKAFFEGNGIFFPKNKILQHNVYKYLSTASIINKNFSEIVEKIYIACNINDDIDKLRVQNLVKNIYYANIFLIDNTYSDFENKRFTLNINEGELEENIKEFGHQRLKQLIGNINEATYNSMWI